MKAPLPDPQGDGLCSHCGAAIPNGQKFCPRCGASSMPSSSGRGFWFWVKFVFLLGLCLGLAFVGTCTTIQFGSQFIRAPSTLAPDSLLFFVPFSLGPLAACGFLARALARLS